MCRYSPLLKILACVAVPLLLMSASHAQDKPDGKEINQANEILIESVLGTMKSVADEYDVDIDTRSPVFVSRDDTILVNTGIEGLRDLKLSSFRDGVDAMFIYLGGDEVEGLESGYYIVRLKSDVRDERGSFEARAELLSVLDRQVKKTVATHITVLDDDTAPEKCQYMPTGEVSVPHVLADLCGFNADCNCCLTWDVPLKLKVSTGS